MTDPKAPLSEPEASKLILCAPLRLEARALRRGLGDRGQGAAVLELPQQPEPVQVQHAAASNRLAHLMIIA